MPSPAIDIVDLRVRRGGRDLLSVERLTISQGEVFVVLGPNGAGKSTLVRTCLGFVRPTTGSVRVLGDAIERLHFGRLSRLRRRVGYVPQLLAAQSETPLTLREVVAIGRTGRAGLFRPLQYNDWRQVDQWIERLGLTRLARHAYRDLSGGEQRKTLIAKAMVQEPEILLLDEPTANLDLFWREQIVATLERLYAETGLTIVLVCHELEVMPGCTGRLVVLEDGRPTAIGRPDGVLTPGRVTALYGEGLQVVCNGGRYAVIPQGAASQSRVFQDQTVQGGGAC